MRTHPPTDPASGPLAAGDPFRAIADAGRRLILDAMALEECSVSQLTKLLGISQPAVSQHLRVLREAGLVAERREGRFHYYRVRAEPLRRVHDWVAQYDAFWNDRLDALQRHLQERNH